MRFKRMWAMFMARNREFFRDRAAFGWNFLFPLMIVVGFGLIFGNKAQSHLKIGVFPAHAAVAPTSADLPERFGQSTRLSFIGIDRLEEGLEKLRYHKLDLFIEAGPPPLRYWINDSAPNGYLAENILQASLAGPEILALLEKNHISGDRIRYVDWLFPGVLGMNMMFSTLYGVGFVVVRYRKNGVLKRLGATPLSAFEYLSAQMLSRIFVLMFTLVVVWFGCDLMFSFEVRGSYLDLFLVFFLGGFSLIALGLILAARGTSEEFTSGVLNFIAWPMMFLSEVWFSLEGTPAYVTAFAKIFPLTHMLSAVRQIMHDGAGLMAVRGELAVLVVMTLVFLIIGASLFSWNR